MEEYKSVSADSVEAVKDQVGKFFKEKAWIYAVLDFAVGFGIYEDRCYSIGLRDQKIPVSLDWSYLKELRVFNRDRELCIVRLKTGWSGRVRGSMPDGIAADPRFEEYFIDECQKLWGNVKKSASQKESNWSLLTSGRGTRIWLPVPDMRDQEEAGILVKKFMRVPVEDNQELVHQTDIRMVDFCSWKRQNEKGGEENDGIF